MDKRYFLAIIPPADLRQKIYQTSQSAIVKSNNFRQIAFENLHITLIFFGATERFEEIKEIARQVLGEICTINITLKGLGLFPNKRQPKTIWIGIEDSESLRKTNLSLYRKFSSAGFTLDDRPYSAHLSLVRIKKYGKQSRNLAREIVEKNRKLCMGTFSIGEIYLMESILKENGPEYKIIDTFKLKENNV